MLIISYMECLRCNHSWEPRGKTPVQCPSCKSYAYNKPRSWRKLVETNQQGEVVKIEQPIIIDQRGMTKHFLDRSISLSKKRTLFK